jgi:hypothetical protein
MWAPLGDRVAGTRHANVLAEADSSQPRPDVAHDMTCSNSAFASFRSGASKAETAGIAKPVESPSIRHQIRQDSRQERPNFTIRQQSFTSMLSRNGQPAEPEWFRGHGTGVPCASTLTLAARKIPGRRTRKGGVDDGGRAWNGFETDDGRAARRDCGAGLGSAACRGEALWEAVGGGRGACCASDGAAMGAAAITSWRGRLHGVSS